MEYLALAGFLLIVAVFLLVGSMDDKPKNPHTGDVIEVEYRGKKWRAKLMEQVK
jgi:hypothetical protein